MKSILEAGKRLCDNNDSYSNLKNDLEGLKGFKFSNDDRQKFKANQDVIELMNKVESAISAFINKFYKSESSGDSKVSQ